MRGLSLGCVLGVLLWFVLVFIVWAVAQVLGGIGGGPVQ